MCLQTHISVEPAVSSFLGQDWGLLSQHIPHLAEVVAGVLRELTVKALHTFPVQASGKRNQSVSGIPGVCVLGVVFNGWCFNCVLRAHTTAEGELRDTYPCP